MPKNYDLVFIGHFAIDTIIYNKIESHSVGGGVTYGSLAAYYYNNKQKVGICSEIGKDFPSNFLDIFSDTNIDLSGIRNECPHSTNYRLYYHDGTRDLTLQSKADLIEFKNMPDKFKSARCFMLCPIANEIPLVFIDEIIENTDAYIGIDVQGFIRKFNPDGSIDKTRDEKTTEIMEYIIKKCNDRLILKASDDEANFIIGSDDVIESTQKLAKLTNGIILSTLGPQGSLIKFKNHKIIHVPALVPNKVVDETGAGDCYSAGFLSEFIYSQHSWDEIKKAGYCASAAASFLLEEKGPHGFGSTKDVQKRLAEKKVIYTPIHDKVKYSKY